MKMQTIKKPLFFSDKIFEISHQENKINLNEKINDLGYQIDVIANEIYSLAGGVEEKKVFLRSPKKKKKKDKPKKNLVEIFNENAKRKKILGPYLRGANKIEDQINLLKNILHNDEATRQDFIKKKKKEEEILKRLDDNYLKNQEMRKIARKLTIKDDVSIVSGETKELNFQKNSTFKNNIFDFYRQFSTNFTEKESQNNKEENDNIRRGPLKSFGTIKLINNLDPLNINRNNNNLINNLDKKGSFNDYKKNNNNHYRNLSFNINANNINGEKIINYKAFSPSSNMNLTNNCNFFSAEKTRNIETLNNLNSANTFSHEHFSRTANRFSTNSLKGNNFQLNSIRKISLVENENVNVDASSDYINFNNQKENKDFINNNISDLNTNVSTLNNGPSITRNQNKKLTLFLQTQEKIKETPLIEKNLNMDSTAYLNFNNMAPHSKKNYNNFNYTENIESFSKLNLSPNNESSNNMQSIFNNRSSRLFSKENLINSPNFRSTGLNFTSTNFNNCNNNNSNFNIKTSPRNHFQNNLNKIQNTTSPEPQSNKNLLTISYSDGSEAFPKIMNTSSKINKHNNLFHSNPKNNKNVIAQTITQACTTTSNKARSIKSKIENYTPINKNVIKNRKLIDRKFLKPDLEKQIENENDQFRKHRGFFIYPKSLLNPVYISDNHKNVLRESNYVDKLNETKAFAARNLIYNKYKVYIGDDDLYNYTNDIRAENTHQDKIENYKQKKIKNNSYHIKKMIANTQMINKEINEMYVELKNKKFVSSSVNKN